MMKNFEILNNFPEYFITKAKSWWAENASKVKHEKGIMFNRVTYDISLDDINRELNIPGLSWAHYSIGEANKGLSQPHVDKRQTTINIPIEVDFDNSFFYITNNDAVHYEEHMKDFRKYQCEYWPTLRYNETDYFKYNVEKPIIANVNVPHGWANYSDKRRVLLGLTFRDTQYSDALSSIPKEWF